MDEKYRRSLTAERLTTLIKKKYGSHGDRARTKEFIYDVNKIDNSILMNKNILSPILNGKKTLSDKHAEVFAEVLNVDAAYLKGFQEYPTIQEGINQLQTRLRTESDLSNEGLFSFLKLRDYQIKPGSYKKTEMPIVNSIRSIHAGIEIRKDEKKVNLSLSELNIFQNEIADYIELRLKYMMQ